jgi:hypothetical protein
MVSAGVEWRASSVLSVAASGRFGGTVRAAREDTLKGKAEAPHRYGIGIQFTGLRGVVLAAGVEEEQWSRMRGMLVGDVDVNDVRTWRVGVEGKGPRWFGAEIPLRVGFHTRELPFAPRGQTVEERSIAGGVGVPLAANRARFDFTLERALRRVSGGAGLPEPEENAWLIGIGFTIRL